MKSIRFILAGLVILLLVMGCTQDNAPKKKAENPDVSKDLGRFVEIRRSKPTDFNALAELYDTRLAKYVRDADASFGTMLDQDVRKALDQGKAGTNVYANAQIAEKSIQRAVILTFSRSLDELAEAGKGSQSLSKIRQAAPVIRSTADRRSGWVGKGKEYPATFEALMGQIVESSEKNDPESLRKAASQMHGLVTKVLVLSVFYELDGLEKARGANADVAAEKREEARIYHINLSDQHGKRDRESAAIVTKQLAGPIDQIDIGLVRDLLVRNFQNELSGVDPVLLDLK